MPKRLSALAFALCAAVAPAAAGSPVVVELFTSQGCSSCPPADAFLARLSERPGVIALAFHVDYWDYLGWQDSFASPAFSKRQRSYARAFGERMVYTPQIVVAGRRGLVGSREDEVEAAIAEAAASSPLAKVTIALRGDALAVTVEAAGAVVQEAQVNLVLFDAPQVVEIGRGENSGRTMTYHNVVRSWMMLGSWSGARTEWVVPLPQDMRGAAVLVQDAASLSMLGAGQYLFADAPRP